MPEVQQKIQITIRDYLKIFFRRKWLFFVPFMIFFFLGIGISFVLPDYFRATTTVLIEDKSFLNAAMKGVTLQSSIKSKLKIMKTEMLSWNNLQSIVKDLGMDVAENIRTQKQLEHFIEKVKENTVIRHSGSKGGIDIIQISYDGRDPELVQKYVNTITDRYIESQLKQQRGDTYGTLDFIKDLTEKYRKNIEESERYFIDYKNKNLQEMPSAGSFTTVGRDLQQYQATLATLKIKLTEKIQSKKYLEEQLAGEREIVVSEMTKSVNPELVQLKNKLQQLSAKLEHLMVRYTDKHPDVIATKAQVGHAKRKLADTEESIVTDEKETKNPVYESIQKQIKEIDLDIETLKARVNGIMGLIKEREDMIRRMNLRETEIGAKQRDSFIDKNIYQTLRTKLENVRITQRIEMGQFGLSIEKLDPARKPLWPVKPDKMKVIFMWMVLGMVIGAGLVVASELNDHSYRGAEDAIRLMEIPVLGTIPDIITEEDLEMVRKKMKIASAFFASLFMTGVLLLMFRYRILEILSI